MWSIRGRLERHTWQYDPSLHAPARYRKACPYDAFIPDPIGGFAEPLGVTPLRPFPMRRWPSTR